ncbi:MAG: choice-of-anchor B family protein [Bacteroidetes bacterium]|nr:choice-of-anchor B family protein [Bacteroidota bacterium]
MQFVRTTVLLLLSLVVFDMLYAQGGSNVQFIGQMRTRGTSGYSQIWGYTAPGGKEYAILGCFGGTQIVDITGDTLKEAAFIPGPNSGWREMKVYQHYAYIVTEGNGAGLQIIDLDSMKLVNTITNTQIPSGHTVSIEGKYLYVNGSRYKNGGIVVFDLTNPVSPVVVGEYQSEYVHDCVIKNDTIYAAAIYGEGLDIIDATNKADIKRVSVTNYPFSGTHNTDVTTDKKYVFTTDEINNNPDHNGNILRVWDRTDVTNLKLVGSYVARPHTIVHNIHVKGNYGYLAHYSEGVRILDIHYPEIPVEVAHYDTYIGSVNGYVGAWGTFPYFISNKVIISDISGGLFVMRFAGQDGSVKAARAIVTVLDSATNLPLSDVKVTLSGRLDTLLTDAAGNVKFGSLSDTLLVTFSKSTYSTGYGTRVQNIVMQYDTVISVTVYMSQMKSGSLTVKVINNAISAPVKDILLSVANTPVKGITDTVGEFSIPALLGGRTFSVIATQWGFLPETSFVTIIGGAKNTITMQLTPNGLDNFEVDLGWTVGSKSDSGNQGIWSRTVATAAVVGADTLQPSYDHTVNGNMLFVTGPSSSPTDYVTYRTTLTSPVFNTEFIPNPSILFWVYFNSRSAAKDDTLYVEVSSNKGGNWKQAAAISGKLPYWRQYRIDLSSLVSSSDQMMIRFVAKDGGASSVFDAAIDDIEFGDNLQLSIDREETTMPDAFVLQQNYPNPFNPSTTIRYSVPKAVFVSLRVYDLLGKEVNTLVHELKQAGRYSVSFNGEGLSSGVYFYKLQTGNVIQTKKLVLMK